MSLHIKSYGLKSLGTASSKVDTKEILRKLVPILGNTGWFISGSFANPNLTNRQVNDIDLFFTTETQFNRADKKFTELNQKDLFSETAHTYYLKGVGRKIQLVKTCFGPPKEVFKSFDLNVCKYALTPTGKRIVDLNAACTLRIDKMNYQTFQRFVKYATRMYKTEKVATLLLGLCKEFAGNDEVVEEVYKDIVAKGQINILLFNLINNSYDISTFNKKRMLREFEEQAPELLI